MSCCHSRAPPFTIRLLVTVARLLWSPSTSFILWSAHHFLPTSSRPPHPHRPRLLARRRRSPRHLSRPCPNHRHRLFSRLAPRSPALLHLRPRTHGHQCPAVGEAVATARGSTPSGPGSQFTEPLACSATPASHFPRKLAAAQSTTPYNQPPRLARTEWESSQLLVTERHHTACHDYCLPRQKSPSFSAKTRPMQVCIRTKYIQARQAHGKQPSIREWLCARSHCTARLICMPITPSVTGDGVRRLFLPRIPIRTHCRVTRLSVPATLSVHGTLLWGRIGAPLRPGSAALRIQIVGLLRDAPGGTQFASLLDALDREMRAMMALRLSNIQKQSSPSVVQWRLKASKPGRLVRTEVAVDHRHAPRRV